MKALSSLWVALAGPQCPGFHILLQGGMDPEMCSASVRCTKTQSRRDSPLHSECANPVVLVTSVLPWQDSSQKKQQRKDWVLSCGLRGQSPSQSREAWLLPLCPHSRSRECLAVVVSSFPPHFFLGSWLLSYEGWAFPHMETLLEIRSEMYLVGNSKPYQAGNAY